MHFYSYQFEQTKVVQLLIGVISLLEMWSMRLFNLYFYSKNNDAKFKIIHGKRESILNSTLKKI